MGKTVDEIALLQGRSVIEIESYLEQALAALEASSMQEALEKASLSEPD
ncbi:LuxR family transcriptional regulator [Agrobacterium rhizogenes]|nr:LuxR family transcriptional regulator [Rhizobium rhizogenes]MCZ7497688.1 LuxR family transcriptional regulator [Rhizobium rhizogenes]